MDVAKLTEERGKVHGDFNDVSNIAQELKNVLTHGRQYEELSDLHREGLEMIVHKIARIVSGDPNHHDHWDDISGYAHIVSKRITK
jgi:hypothetical protein